MLFAVSFAAAMVACSSDSVDTEGVTPSTPTETKTSLNLKGYISTMTQITKVNASGFENSDKVGVYVVTDGSLKNSGNYVDNKAFTYSTGGALTPPSGSEVYWATSNSRLGVFAYYPYANSVSSVSAYPFSVSSDQSSEDALYESDFLWVSASNIAPQKEAVNLSFGHKLSKVNVALVAGNGFETAALTSAQKTFTITGVAVDGTIDLSTGVATAGSEKEEVTPLYNGELGYSAIVYPQTTQVTFKVVVDGSTYVYTAEATFNAGYQYNYTLTLSKPDKLLLMTNGVTEWENGGNETGDLSGIITGLSPQFKAYLVGDDTYDGATGRNDSFKKIDANKDGEISVAEAEAVEYINFMGDANNKEELQGLEFFPNLEYLGVSNISKTTLDVSKNTALTSLSCSYNQLTSLDVSGCTALTFLDCYNNQLTTLDVSGCTALTSLNCTDNQLTTLDVSGCTSLEKLLCYNNQLTSLDVSGCTSLTSLNCSDNQLTSLDVSNNTSLTILDCRSNQLTSLDVSKNTALISLGCYNNQLTSLDVSKNTALGGLFCDYNQLTSLDVSKNTALTRLDCNNNQLISLDVSKNTSLTDLRCYNNQLTSLDVSNNTSLEKLRCDNNLTSLKVLAGKVDVNTYSVITWVDEEGNTITIPADDPVVDIDSGIKDVVLSICDINNDGQISQTEAQLLKRMPQLRTTNLNSFKGLDAFINIEGLKIYGNRDSEVEYDLDLTVFPKLKELNLQGFIVSNKTLDLSGHQYLEKIRIDNVMEAVDLSDCPNLVEAVFLGHNENRILVKSVDVTNSTALEYLKIELSNISTLDVSTNTALTYLLCSYSKLSTIDVSKNTALTLLSCHGNNISSLDVSKNTELITLVCGESLISSIDLSNQPLLESLYIRHCNVTTLDLSNNPKLRSLMVDEDQITKIYLKTGQEITFAKPESAVIEYK